GYTGALLFHLGRGHLVGCENRHDFIHSFPGFQGLLGAVALLAQGGDHGAFGADNDVAAQPKLLDPFLDVIDLHGAGAGFHDDDHKNLQELSAILFQLSAQIRTAKTSCYTTTRAESRSLKADSSENKKSPGTFGVPGLGLFDKSADRTNSRNPH